MNQYLYRGVSVADDEENNGQLLPKGKHSSSFVYCGQEGAVCGAGYVCGSSEGNAVRAHQVKSGMNDGCYVSTTKDKKVAKKFATIGNFVDGYIYILDPRLFSKFGVVIHELLGSELTGEHEISIRSKDNGPIPKEVIINKELIRIT